jgi:hypothetical protein
MTASPSTTAPSRDPDLPAPRRWITPFVLGAYFALYFAAAIALGYALPWWGRLAIAAVPAAGSVALLWFVIRAARGSDELERHIHLRAAAHSFVILVFFLLASDLLRWTLDLEGFPRGAGFRPPASALMPMVIGVYAGAYLNARRYFHPVDAAADEPANATTPTEAKP